MDTRQPVAQNIDEYIAGFPSNVQEIMEKIRMTIREAAPEAEETISYAMPTFNLNGKYLVYFAAYKKHIGFYGAPRGNTELKEQVSVYEAGRGTLQFPFDKPIPFDLITRIVRFRVEENLAQTAVKGKKR